MDIPFDAARWEPTHRSIAAKTSLDQDALQAFSLMLAKQTKNLLRYPYDPQRWLDRSETLRKLKYPELALGDARKATLLCREHLRSMESRWHNQWRLGNGMGFWMLDEGALDPDAIDSAGLKEHLTDSEDQARRSEERNLCISKEDGTGKFRSRPYPWLTPERSSRSDELVSKVNRELATKAESGLQGPLACELKQHAFGDSGPDSRNILGVFATRDAAKGETILVDQSRIWGCTGPGTMGDLDNLHGGSGCGDPIHPNLPEEDYDKDLRWIRDETGKDASTVLGKCRLLLVAVQDNISNPLDHSLVARLTPTYNYDAGLQMLYRHTDIDIPFCALQQFGIDIFANYNFDTWVLFTIFARAENNSCGCSLSEALMPLFSFFNHSCDPNIDWFRPRGGDRPDNADTEKDDNDTWYNEQRVEEGMDHATVVMTACRDIKRGEQFFVEYDPFSHEDNVWKRRKRLKKWLVDDCMCERCVKEEKVMPKPAEASSSSSRESSGSDASGSWTTASWDDSEPVELPEDQFAEVQ